MSGRGALIALLCGLAAPAWAAEAPVEEDYALHCIACHGADGAGVPGVTPSLTGIGALLEAPGGRAYLARVPGVAQAALPDARLARLLNWVLARYAGVSPDPPYSAAEIGALRRSPLRDTRSARAALAVAPQEPSP